MEDVLQVYHVPYDADYPQVCMDETCKQLIGEVQAPRPCAPGRAARVDHEYVRHGVAQIFLEVKPLTGRRHVAAMEHRTRKDWAWWIKGMLDEGYPPAVRVRLVSCLQESLRLVRKESTSSEDIESSSRSGK